MNSKQHIYRERQLGIIGLLIISLLLVCRLQVSSQVIVKSGTSMKILNATSVTSSETVILNSGGALDDQGTLVLKKNLENQNTAPNAVGSGTVVFSGTASQSVSGQTIFQHLTVSNPAGLSVDGNTQVKGTLTLTSGVVTLGASNLLLDTAASVSGTPSSINMVVATGSGELRKTYQPAGTFIFPVGNATGSAGYSPVTVTFTGGTFGPDNYVGVNLVNDQYPGTATSYLNRYWNVSRSGISDFAANVVFQYEAADISGTEDDIFCTRVDETLPWVTYNAANTGSHTIGASGLSAFGTFTGNLGNGTTPPAIRSLQDKVVDAGVVTCADATQTLLIAGNGTTYEVMAAGSVEHIAGQRIIYYPGTKVHLNGHLWGHISTTTFCNPYIHPAANQLTTGSDEQNSTEPGKNGSFMIYPNPTPGRFTLALKGEFQSLHATVEIFSLLGDKLFSKELPPESRQEFSLQDKPAGVYFVNLRSGTISETQKIIKQ